MDKENLAPPYLSQVAVKEFRLNYHNGCNYTYIYIIAIKRVPLLNAK